MTPRSSSSARAGGKATGIIGLEGHGREESSGFHTSAGYVL